MTKTTQPLADRMRPKHLNELIGQEALVSENGILTRFIENQSIPSMILWGPPGVGKTTLAYLLAKELNYPFYTLSATSSGVKEVREIIAKAESEGHIILFIDEIHRFNKSQQDSLLKAVEQGTITLIGATTENPSFEVNRALLSRSNVYVLNELTVESLKQIALNALKNDEILNKKNITIDQWDALLIYSSGDARKLLTILEMVSNTSTKDIHITDELVSKTIQTQQHIYDKNGEMHYDIISAFIKSMRGSDPNGAIYWMAKMIEGGEDPKFIARRMIIFASEDIGMANSNALLLANACFESVEKIGYPECSIILAHTAVYLATSLKSNGSYKALKNAQKSISQKPNLSVPLHLRNAPTKLMKDLGYGDDYAYAHNYQGNFVEQDYLPKEIKNEVFYHPNVNPRENEVLAYLKKWWPKKYK